MRVRQTLRNLKAAPLPEQAVFWTLFVIGLGYIAYIVLRLLKFL